jgi:hypothetical protein
MSLLDLVVFDIGPLKRDRKPRNGREWSSVRETIPAGHTVERSHGQNYDAMAQAVSGAH